MQQGESIRHYLQRRDRWISTLRIAGWVLLLALVALVFWDSRNHRYLRIGGFFAFCICLGATGYLSSGTRCPRCGFDLRSKAMTSKWAEVAKDRCPSCSVSLDESRKLG